MKALPPRPLALILLLTGMRELGDAGLAVTLDKVGLTGLPVVIAIKVALLCSMTLLGARLLRAVRRTLCRARSTPCRKTGATHNDEAN